MGNRDALRAAAALGVLSLAAGCGGGATTAHAPAVPLPTPAAVRTAAAAATAPPVPSGPPVAITVTIRPRSPMTAARRRRTVPVAFQSVALTATPTSGEPFTATTSCTTVCNATVIAPSGGETFVAQLYDAPGGTGHLVGAGRTSATIVADQNNVVPIVTSQALDTISASVSPASLPAGAAGDASVTIAPADAAGNVIASGPMVDAQGNLLTVTLTPTPNAPAVSSGYAAGSATLATSTVTDAKNLASVALHYDGRALLDATVGATVAGGTVTTPIASATLAIAPAVYEYPGVGQARDARVGPDGKLWFAQWDGVSQFAVVTPPGPGATSVTPALWPLPSGFGFAIDFSSDGQVWTTNWGANVARCPYPPSNAATYAASCTILDIPNPDHTSKIAFGSDGAMYLVSSYREPDRIPLTQPAASTVGEATASGAGGGEWLTADTAGRLWYAGYQYSCCGHQYAVALTPSATIGVATYVPATPGGSVDDVLPGKDGNIWMSSVAGNAVGRFATDGSNAFPVTMPSAGGNPQKLAAASDAMYAAYSGTPTIARIPYTATSTADVTEYPLSAKATMLLGGPDGNVYGTLANGNLVKVAL